MKEFVERYRTRITQLLAAAYILVFAFSENGLESTHPALPGVMMLAGCALVGMATVGRLWCALYIAGYKTDRLITEGPYSMCRNPLYFFSFVGAAGVGLCTEYLSLAAVIVAAFALLYPVTIEREEERLLSIYGGEYRAYLERVPRFVPKLRLLREPAQYTVNAKIFRREVCDAFFFAAAVGLLEMIEQFNQIGLIKTFFVLY